MNMGAAPATKSLRQIAYAKPLRECGLEELAVHQVTANPSGGILFARKIEHTNKDLARQKVLELFTRSRFPDGLAILTMPGLNWKFERKLFGKREGNWFKKDGPKRTHLTCIESDRAIYHGALVQMPGLQQRGSITCVLPATPFSERVVRNRWIGRFFFGNIDDLMQHQPVPFDAAWLDYTGPLSIKRLEIIEKFWQENIRSILVITALKARWNRDTSDEILRRGGHSEWLKKHLEGEVLHDFDYQDGASPMTQFAIKKSVR
jgi:hypothetical protein